MRRAPILLALGLALCCASAASAARLLTETTSSLTCPLYAQRTMDSCRLTYKTDYGDCASGPGMQPGTPRRSWSVLVQGLSPPNPVSACSWLAGCQQECSWQAQLATCAIALFLWCSTSAGLNMHPVVLAVPLQSFNGFPGALGSGNCDCDGAYTQGRFKDVSATCSCAVTAAPDVPLGAGRRHL